MPTKRLSDIKGYENTGQLVKFLKQEYLENLLNGKIYMNNFKYFIDLELKEKIKGQGDKLEIGHVIRGTDGYIMDTETNTTFGTVRNVESVERYVEMDKMPVFCVAEFTSEDYLVINEDEDKVTAKIDLPLEDQKYFEKNFGEIAVALPNDFMPKFYQATQESQRLAIGKVDYINYNFYSLKRKKEFDEMSINILFWKDEFFNKQREVRFILTNELVDSDYTLEIGDIREKAIVTNTKSFFKEEFNFCLPIIK